MAADETKVLALILAGGAGSRLDVLTERRAKPSLPFAGVYRLIDFPLSNCVHSGISDVWVVQQYQPQSLDDHLSNGRPWDLDRTYGGLRILHPFQARDGGGFHQGNADAIHRHRGLIREFGPDVLLVTSADHVYRLDYREVVAEHLAHGADVTMVTTRVPREEAGRFGVVRPGRDGRIEGFDYKPNRPPTDVVTTEVFAFEPGRLLQVLEELAGDDDGGEDDSGLEDLGDEVLPTLVAEGKAFEHRLEGYWRDLGTVQSYWQGHMDLLDTSESDPTALDLDDERWPILTRGHQRSPARVLEGAVVRNSLLSPGCVVRGEVDHSVLGPGVRVEEGAVVRDSVVLDDATIRAGAKVVRAIVDTRAVVEEEASVAPDTDVALVAMDTVVRRAW